MNKPRLLVTGATGLLGTAILQEAALDYTVIGLSRHPEAASTLCLVEAADLTNPAELTHAVEKHAPKIIIHTAALAFVDQCEKEPDRARAVNVEGTRNLLRAISGRSCRLIHISTDSVFDGRTGNYREEDPVSPVHFYGRTKLEAEKLVLENRPDALVVRAPFYGTITPERKVKSLAEWILSCLRQGQQVPGFTDILFSPLPAHDLARALLELAGKPVSGILHVGGSEGCSKYEFARALAAAFGFSPNLIFPTTSDSAPMAALRPHNTTLCIEKATRALGRPLPNLKEGLHSLRSLDPMPAERSA